MRRPACPRALHAHPAAHPRAARTRFAGPARALCPTTRCPAPYSRYPASAPCTYPRAHRLLPCQRAMRPALPAHHAPCPACSTRPALPARHVPCPACATRHAPCLACDTLPCQRTLTYVRHTPVPCPAHAKALHCPCQRCPARCPALPCPAWLPPELPCTLPGADLPCVLALPARSCPAPSWAVRWGATTGGTCESTPAGSVASRRGASVGAEPEEALHTFTLDSGASRCFFHNNTTITPLTAPVPITLADPSGGPVVARGATVLPCPAAPSGLRRGLHLPSFAKNLVATFVLQDQWSALVAESCQVAALVEVAASCSCHLLTHQTLPWHHHLGHPSLPRLRGMHSRLLVLGLPRSLPLVPKSLALPCLPCVEGRQRAAPHSSSFPPTTAPLQTLYMDVWGPARVSGQGGERYFLLVLDDYTCYTIVFPLHSKADECGGEFCSHLLEDFCGAKDIVHSYTLSASVQQNGSAERHIGLVMEVARTSMIHVATPHFLWLFVVRYTAEQLNLWPHVSHPETSSTLRWTGEVGDASTFWVWGSLSLVRDLPAGKLSPRTIQCVFLGFPTTYRLGSFTTRALVVCCPPATSPLTSPSAYTVFTPTAVPRYPSHLSPWWTTPPW
ncbi:unnamed protein product [Closterium sp. NIES-53]